MCVLENSRWIIASTDQRCSYSTGTYRACLQRHRRSTIAFWPGDTIFAERSLGTHAPPGRLMQSAVKNEYHSLPVRVAIFRCPTVVANHPTTATATTRTSSLQLLYAQGMNRSQPTLLSQVP